MNCLDPVDLIQTDNDVIALKVPNSTFVYHLQVGERMPTFSFWAKSEEVYHRLLYKATQTKSLFDLQLYKSERTPSLQANP